MPAQWIQLLALLSPVAFIGLAVYFHRQPARWPLLLGFLPCGLAIVVALATSVTGASVTTLLDSPGLGIPVHLDALSVTLLLLITTIGGSVLHFSRQYLRGDPRHGLFMTQLALTFAAVTTLVIAGNLLLMVLAWVSMSLLLHQLLLFRHERPSAQVAAKKKYLLARLGDLALIVAFGILIDTTETANLPELLARLKAFDGNSADSLALGFAAGLIALTAMLKSAQFPAHGWLVEVMETPTPVSALLHAGVVNAGGFLFLRFSDLMTLTPGVSLFVALVGILTAVIGAAIMLAQSTVKGSLAYSTVAQMGFMMAQCGLGAYSAALVHLVGHSLYKAYAFLGSGSAVQNLKVERWADARQAASGYLGVALLALMLTVYAALGWAAGMSWQSTPVELSLGAIFVMGIWLFADVGRQSLKHYGYVLAGVAIGSILYFAVQQAAHLLFDGSVAAPRAPSQITYLLLSGLLMACLCLVIVQGRHLASNTGLLMRWRQHLAQGLYINLIVNRWLGAYSSRHSHAD